ncbi:hypothetical protein PFLmoz3_01830 [Pseudomonas fluorescens]|uniref:Uncharacterized protein n=1 Tax=Pseudomonas fluorescens TaxID=294 RepID=A0A120G8J4_PSEFL|nr:hypothetical protein PFLmoz3_01830 [Pseudomonas fluorescens]
MMNRPVITSCTSCWEPKPIASPTTPAPASNGATLMPRLAMVVIAQITTRMIFTALRSSGRMVFTRVLGWRLERLFTGGLRASWIAVSSTTQNSQVTNRIRPILLRESLMARPTELRWANSNSETPQIRPSISINAMAMTIRKIACSKLRKRSL